MAYGASTGFGSWGDVAVAGINLGANWYAGEKQKKAAKKQRKRDAREEQALRNYYGVSQQSGWGTSGPRSGGISGGSGWGGGYAMPHNRGFNALGLAGAPVPYDDWTMKPSPYDPMGGGAGRSPWFEAGKQIGEWALGQFGRKGVTDPTPGPWAPGDPNAEDNWGDAEYEANARRTGRRLCDKSIPYMCADGRVKTYVPQGNPILFTSDISAVKRVQRVAATCAGALLGTAPKRRTKKKRRGRARRRKVACRTLTPKQLAAGFGGKRYRT
jgi:hypothetical protein